MKIFFDFSTFSMDGVLRGLYSGTFPALSASISENSVMMMTYGQGQVIMKTLLGKETIDDLRCFN